MSQGSEGMLITKDEVVGPYHSHERGPTRVHVTWHQRLGVALARYTLKVEQHTQQGSRAPLPLWYRERLAVCAATRESTTPASRRLHAREERDGRSTLPPHVRG